MPDPLLDYFQRINPTLKRPEEGSSRFPSVNLTKALDRLTKQLFVVTPAALDRCRYFRNRFDDAVK